MTQLRILIFNWRCWLSPDAGGAEVFTYEVSKRWVEDGHEVTLFAGEFPDCEKEEVVDGVRIVRAGGKYSLYRKAKRFYKERFSKEDFDVVVDEINTRPFLTPKFVGHGEKIVALIHQLAREYWFYETPFPVSYIGYYFLENRWLRNYADVPTVTVSESTRQDLLNLRFKKVFVVPEGLNFRPLNAVPEKESFPVVVYVGRLRKAKRPDHALTAFDGVREKLPSAELWVIGDGSFRRDLDRMAGEGIRFFGRLDDAKRRELIGRSWVLVNPSVREGWGLNVVESNASGTPCVAYDVAGLRDSVRDGETGLLAESGNAEDLAEKLLAVLKNERFRLELSKKALVNSQQHNWCKTAEEFMGVLKGVVES